MKEAVVKNMAGQEKKDQLSELSNQRLYIYLEKI